MLRGVLVCSVLCVLIPLAWGYGSGAPAEVCSDMTPQHGVPPMTTLPPYSVTVSKRSITQDQFLYITVAGKNSKKFKGFLVQGRVGEQQVGSFEPDPSIKLVDCGNGRQNAATHTSPNEKQKVVLKWKAPRGLSETVVFNVTVAQDGGTYWVGLNSPRVSVGKSTGRQ